MHGLDYTRGMSEASVTQPRQPRAAVSPLDIVRLLVELAVVFSGGFWGFVAWSFPANIAAGILAPALAILIWALFLSPRAVFAVHPFVRAIIELLLYAAATIAWWSLDQTWIGVGFALVATVTGLLTGRRRFT